MIATPTNMHKTKTEEEQKETVNLYSHYWDVVAEREKSRYKAQGYSGYVPGSGEFLSEEKLREAVEEFSIRYDEEDDTSDYIAVLVSSDIKQTPYRQMELKALSGLAGGMCISKAWYALTKDGDLLIIKIASGDAHSKCVARIHTLLGMFAMQYPGMILEDGDGEHLLSSGTTVAPDGFLQPAYPEPQPVPPILLSPVIIEFEHKLCGPKALLQKLSSYFLQSPVKFVLGIKVYDRTGPAVAAGKRPFAAFAALWKRHATNPHHVVNLVGVWSFGTVALSAASRSAFAKKHGILEQIPKAMMITHPAPNRLVTIPAADILGGIVDQNGAAVPVLANGNDLTIDLDTLADICDLRLRL